MKVAGVIVTFVLMLSGTVASADVVDMRAYSIKRGFKAYHAKKSAGHQPVMHKTAAASPKTGAPQPAAQQPQQQQETPARPPSVSDAKSKQHTEMQKYIDENPEVLPDI